MEEKPDHLFNELKSATKANLALKSIRKPKNMEISDTFAHKKTIICWTNPNMCAPRTTWWNQKRSQENWRQRVV